ncbi:MAG: class I SAM-dependent methyltransferase [Candidatus Aminicenantes bacterium]|nr:class I SAM-dependent methyltransferase [Candidatus Aminicenantes bacterium]
MRAAPDPLRPVRVEKRAVIRFLRGAGPMTKAYLRIKLRICPLLRAEAYFPDRGEFVDLGCGNGLFPAILKLGAPDRRILGLDLDERKIASARKALAGVPGLDFRAGDAAAFDFPPADVYSLVDVLYLLSFDTQDAVLAKCRDALRPGGRLIIKEMDTRPGWKYLWNFIQETIAVKIVGLTLGRRFYFRGRRDTLSRLRSLGLEASAVRLDRGYAYPHILYLAGKDGIK